MTSTAQKTRTWRYEQTLKLLDVEEWIDLHWHRRLAFFFLRPLEHSMAWVTPTKITMAAMAVGIGSGIVLSKSDEHPWAMVLGAALLLASVVLDCMDGMLARLRGGGTRLGMLLDGFCDTVVGVAVWLGMSTHAYTQLPHWWTWPAAAGVLASILAHCVIYDHFKNLYVANVAPPLPGAPPSMPPQPDSRLERVMNVIYDRAYSVLGKAVDGGTSSAVQASPEAYRAELYGPMRMLSWVGLGTQLAVVYSCCLLSLVDGRIPFIALNVVMTGVLNVWLVISLVAWKRAEARLTSRLSQT